MKLLIPELKVWWSWLPRRRALGVALFLVGGMFGAVWTVMAQTGTPTIQFTQASYKFNRTDIGAYITVTLSSPASKAVTVQVSASDGTAKLNEDYGWVADSVLFDVGTTTQTVSLLFMANGETVPEFFTVSLSNPSSNAIVGAPGTTTIILGAGSDPPPTYLPGPPPTIGPIQHVTVNAYPTPTDRTELGVGESMTCWIDPNSWQDIDYQVTPGGIVNVYDGMGVATWSCTPGGSVYPIVGNSNSITFTADNVNVDTPVTISVQKPDLGNFAKDAVPAFQEVQVVDKAPLSVNVQVAKDVDNGWVAGTDMLGNSTAFQLEIAPTTVNFKDAIVRATRNKKTILWPDTTTDQLPAATTLLPITDNGTFVNITSLWMASGLFAVNKIAPLPNNTTFSVSNTIRFDFQAGGRWANFANLLNTWDYRVADNKASIRLLGSDGVEISSKNWQGPWKK